MKSWNDSSTQDLVGKKFSRLLVIKNLPSRHNRSRWLCVCDCDGKECQADGKALRSGKKRSCGCIRKERAREHAATLSENNKLPEGESAFNLLYATYRCGAEHRKFDFLLTKNDFLKLTSENCDYCGAVPHQIIGSKNGNYVYNGVDRKNNAAGYVIDNCVSCCGTCNLMKRMMSVEQFLQACQAVVDHQSKRLGESAAH